MNANFRHYAIPDLENLPDAENPGGFIDRVGLEPKRAPRASLYISFQYSKDYLGGTINTFAGYRLYSDYQTHPVLPVAQILNWTTWDLSIDYVWKHWTVRLFSQNVKNKRYLQNVRNISQAEVWAQNVVTPDFAPLITIGEYNQPRYSGFEIIFRPDVASLLKKAKKAKKAKKPSLPRANLSKVNLPKPNLSKLKPTFLRNIPLINKLPIFKKKDDSPLGDSSDGEADKAKLG